MEFTYENIYINMTLDEDHIPLMEWSIENRTFREEPLLRFLKDNKIISKDSIVLDIGSYIGNHVVYYSKIVGVKKVIAIEPTLKSFEILLENIKNNNINNVECNNIAILSKSGFAECNIRSKKNPAKNQWINVNHVMSNCVQTVTLSEFTDEKIDFIKIDVEGMEMEVLGGGKKLIEKYKPYIMIEVSKNNLDAFELYMKNLNYVQTGKEIFTLNRKKKANTLLYKEN